MIEEGSEPVKRVKLQNFPEWLVDKGEAAGEKILAAVSAGRRRIFSPAIRLTYNKADGTIAVSIESSHRTVDDPWLTAKDNWQQLQGAAIAVEERGYNEFVRGAARAILGTKHDEKNHGEATVNTFDSIEELEHVAQELAAPKTHHRVRNGGGRAV